MELPAHERFPMKFDAIQQDRAVLALKSVEVDINSAEQVDSCKTLIGEMQDILYIHKPGSDAYTANEIADLAFNNVIGYGLSAVQLKSVRVGEAPRLALVVFPQAMENGRVVKATEEFWMVNPVITKLNKTYYYKGEGCLSLPGVYHNTNRFLECAVGFIDLRKLLETGDAAASAREITFVGTEAVVMQHEVDHHDGRIFLEKARIPIQHTKVGANEPCPCGSGKKYKKCCSGKL